MYAGGFGNQILTDWGFLQKRKKKSRFGRKFQQEFRILSV